VIVTQQELQQPWRVQLVPAGLAACTNTQHVGGIQNEPFKLNSVAEC